MNIIGDTSVRIDPLDSYTIKISTIVPQKRELRVTLMTGLGLTFYVTIHVIVCGKETIALTNPGMRKLIYTTLTSLDNIHRDVQEVIANDYSVSFTDPEADSWCKFGVFMPFSDSTCTTPLPMDGVVFNYFIGTWNDVLNNNALGTNRNYLQVKRDPGYPARQFWMAGFTYGKI